MLMVLLSGSLRLAAQEPLSYLDMLAGTREIKLSDSLNFDTSPDEVTALDSNTVKKWFFPVLSSGSNKFKNKTYSLAGKITGNSQFDLLVLLEDKRRSDSTGIQVTYLVSARKTGEYIASLKAAVSGTKKKTGYNITSCLYKDNRIVQDSRITINDKVYDDLTRYRISNGGRFIQTLNN